MHLEEYKKNRDAARRSPYPSVIVEVRSTPPPDFGERKQDNAKAEQEGVTSDDVRRLEALFGSSAAGKSTVDPFYDALGEVRTDRPVRCVSALLGLLVLCVRPLRPWSWRLFDC